MTPQPLQGRITVVTGASRGAGKGIAVALGEAGATVYVTGRSSTATGSTHRWPGTIDETAAAVTAAGGVGIPVRVDHGEEPQVAALFQRIRTEQGRLDLLVNNAWSAHDAKEDLGLRPFWEIPTRLWEPMINGGARLGLLASTHAVPLMLAQGRGLIVNTTFWDHGEYTGNLYYDLAKNTINRLAYDMAQDLKPHGIAAVAVSPGWMRTELVLQAMASDEAHWRENPALATTESPFYVGRAVAALAADPAIMARSGHCLTVGELAREYGFTDIDGRQPPPFRVAATLAGT
jgi:NAD(P)-dependent dehydrogenase (short-subunit alcohol dehydrogenase family)